MLTEIAVTPQVFDSASANVDRANWREQLRRMFFARMLPERGVPRCSIVSNLHAGNWKKAFDDIVKAATDPADIDFLKELQTRIQALLVLRPAAGSLPANEPDWAVEAYNTGQKLPLDRIVISERCDAKKCSYVQPRMLPDADAHDFWNVIEPVRNPAMVLNVQLSTLRPLITHYSYLSFVSPFVQIGNTKDLGFATELLRAAIARPAGFPPPKLIDLHTENAGVAQDVLNHLQKELQLPRPRVRLYSWPKRLERLLLAGHDVGATRPQVLWAVSLTHVVRPVMDGPDADIPTFSMLPAKQVAFWSNKLYGLQPRGPVPTKIELPAAP